MRKQILPSAASTSIIPIKELIEENQLLPVVIIHVHVIVAMARSFTGHWIREEEIHHTLTDLLGDVFESHHLAGTSGAFHFEGGAVEEVVSLQSFYYQVVDC